jgi:hypothetical protein
MADTIGDPRMVGLQQKRAELIKKREVLAKFGKKPTCPYS